MSNSLTIVDNETFMSITQKCAAEKGLRRKGAATSAAVASLKIGLVAYRETLCDVIVGRGKPDGE